MSLVYINLYYLHTTTTHAPSDVMNEEEKTYYMSPVQLRDLQIANAEEFMLDKTNIEESFVLLTSNEDKISPVKSF